MSYHMAAFAVGFVLDLILGDPEHWSHPVRWMGNLIQKLTEIFLGKANRVTEAAKRKRKKRAYGSGMVVLVVLISGSVSALLLLCAYRIHPVAGCLLEAWLTYRLLAAKSLRDASMKVYQSLTQNTLTQARHAVSMIVGRDTENLTAEGVTKAAVETVAENTSDGVIAPLLYMAIGGPVLGMVYKSINTMDSMVGYKNEKYMDYGRTAAKLDDVANFLPARISGLLMVVAAFLLKPLDGFDGRNAWRIFRRDRRKHASPNAAHTEAACAGALGVQLAGDTPYFGKVVSKPTLGDGLRPITPDDIPKANHLMMGTAWLCQILCLVGMMTMTWLG